MSHPARLFAIIPAAGLSRRMGEPKLLLNLAGQTVIARLLNALDHPRMTSRSVVVRQSDIPDRKSTRLNSSHIPLSRMPSSA